MKSDSALTEITGFLLILTMTILFAAVFTASALPEILETEERKQNDELLFQFASMQKEMETLALAKEQRIIGRSDLDGLAAKTSHLTLSYGKVIPSAGKTFREAVITYTAENPVSGYFSLSLGRGGLWKNGEIVRETAYLLAVNPEETAEQMEITKPFRIEYTWQETITTGDESYQVFIVRFA